MGPVVNEVSSARFEDAAAQAPPRRRGGGRRGSARSPRPFRRADGRVGLPKGHRLEREELFLPFVTVTRVGSFDEAIDEANAPVYGLTAGIYSEDEAEQERFLARSRPG